MITAGLTTSFKEQVLLGVNASRHGLLRAPNVASLRQNSGAILARY